MLIVKNFVSVVHLLILTALALSIYSLYLSTEVGKRRTETLKIIPKVGELPRENWKKTKQEKLDREELTNDEIKKEDLKKWGFEEAILTVFQRKELRVAFVVVSFSTHEGPKKFFEKTFQSLKKTNKTYPIEIGTQSFGLYDDSLPIDLIIFQKKDLLTFSLKTGRKNIKKKGSLKYSRILDKKIF